MPYTSRSLRPDRRWLAAAAAVLLVSACGDQHPSASEAPSRDLPAASLQVFDCRAEVTSGTVSCGVPQDGNASHLIIGGQNDYVRLSSSNISMGGGVFQFDVTVQNLLNEAIGTPDGVTPDVDGIRVFFFSGPTMMTGTGTVSVLNPDGEELFMGSEQPYFRYNQILAKDQVSAPRTWQFAYDPGVESFAFKVYVSTEVQPLLVINEMLVNPGGTITDAAGEWIEIYNAGRMPVQMQDMVIADSAASGRRPYHLISSPLTVAPGGYVVIGNSANTTNNGGVVLDYEYGMSMSFANSLDAFKIARVYGTDTLTIDRVQYASAGVSAQNGISRELKNPALDNANMDGSNWADALVTAVYGPGGRGTPKAQNSTYTP